MEDLAKRDYFSDHSVLTDPHAYFEAIRAKGPIHQLDNGIVMVTGFEESLEVLNNSRDFSSLIASQGPAAPLPFTPEGSDITEQIEAHRKEVLTGDLISSRDDRQHSMSRALLSRLFTPSRLKANEKFIDDCSDQFVRAAVARGGCELIKEIATPFVTLVIADLLGVPPADRQLFMDTLDSGPQPGSLDSEELLNAGHQLVVMGTYFAQYVEDRRAKPRDDILSELSNASYPDGSIPDAAEIVRLATFLFAAGQDSTAKYLGNAMRLIVDEPGLQDKLRADRSIIPAFIEEALRLDSPIKMNARLARHDTQIGDLAVPAGTRVMVALPAANRDSRRWQDPEALILDRPKIKEHVAFSRGAHVCIGAPLARTEVRMILEKFFEYTSHIDIDRRRHPNGSRDLQYEPSFIIRGLAEMHLKLEPAPGFSPS